MKKRVKAGFTLGGILVETIDPSADKHEDGSAQPIDVRLLENCGIWHIGEVVSFYPYELEDIQEPPCTKSESM